MFFSIYSNCHSFREKVVILYIYNIYFAWTNFSVLKGTDRPPDVLAFLITIGMMIVIAAGVKKSLVFNNILNVLNFAAWVFLMGAGLFYVDTKTWSQHEGFLPMGWSGVGSIV